MSQDKKKLRTRNKYYWINGLITFFFMAALVSIAIAGTLIFLEVSDKKDVISSIFIENLPAIIFSAFGLTVFFSASQLLFTKFIVKRPTREFIKATNKVVKGDYTAKIDISKIKFASVEYYTIAENFNKMVEELNDVDSLSNDFISNVSHELKTPLSVIQSYVTILQTPGISQEEKHEYLNKIMISTRQLTSLVTNILKLNKMENDQIEVKKEKYNLTSQLSQCVLDFENLIDEKELEIIFEVEDDVKIYGDEELMNIVWTNLISNAIKFSPDKGMLKVKLIKHLNYVQVKISDNGCGMDENTQKHIFEKFYQGDTSHSAKGNGLGLALVRRVIDLTNNEIEVKSELQKGTTFTVTINQKVADKI